MRIRTKQGLHTLRRAHAFLVTHDREVALGSLRPQIDKLAIVLERLERHASEQDSAARCARAGTEVKREREEVLRLEFLRPISRIARSLSSDEGSLQSAFHLPYTRDAEGLLQLAGAFAERAEEHRVHFIADGLASDFVERLRSATEQFRESIVTRDLDYGRRASATAGLVADVTRGRSIVRIIDAMLAPRLRKQPDLLAEWRTIARFVRRPRTQVPEEAGERDRDNLAQSASETRVTPLQTHLAGETASAEAA